MGIASNMPAEFSQTRIRVNTETAGAYDNKDRLTHFSDEAYNKGR
ncbi:Catalase [Bacillus licheniformis]